MRIFLCYILLFITQIMEINNPLGHLYEIGIIDIRIRF